MTTENPVPPTETGDSAADAAKSTDHHTIPKARLDAEIARRRELEDSMSTLADTLLAEVPDHLKAMIPDDLGPAAKIKWFQKAKEAGVFKSSSTVPATDQGKPTITPRETDFNSLPASSRIAAGYRRN